MCPDVIGWTQCGTAPVIIPIERRYGYVLPMAVLQEMDIHERMSGNVVGVRQSNGQRIQLTVNGVKVMVVDFLP